MPNGLKEFLTRSVLDIEFRKQAIADPQAAIADYDLSDEEADILCAGDARVLSLLGKVLRSSWGSTDEATREASGTEVSGIREREPTQQHSPIQVLPDFGLRLRLTPQAVQTEDGTLHCNHAANLFPWTDEPPAFSQSETEVGPSPTVSSSGVDLHLKVFPSLLANEDGSSSITYTATIGASPSSGHATIQESIDKATATGKAADRMDAIDGDDSDTQTIVKVYGGRSYRIGGSDVKLAADIVKSSNTDERYFAVLDLLDKMRGDADDA